MYKDFLRSSEMDVFVDVVRLCSTSIFIKLRQIEHTIPVIYSFNVCFLSSEPAFPFVRFLQRLSAVSKQFPAFSSSSGRQIEMIPPK